VILALPDAEHRIAVNNGATADPPHGHLLPSERALPRNRSGAAAARPRNRSQADPAPRFMVELMSLDPSKMQRGTAEAVGVVLESVRPKYKSKAAVPPPHAGQKFWKTGLRAQRQEVAGMRG
jgi:hypothetical protein